jgi:hypothetical protein
MGWLWGALAGAILTWAGNLIGRVFGSPPAPDISVAVEVKAAGDSEQHSNMLPGAEEASLRLLRAELNVLSNLGIVSRLGVPPSVQGGAWTWPQVFRSLRAVVDSANVVAEEVLIIRTLGPTILADAALEAAQHLANLLQNSNPTNTQRRDFVPQVLLEETVASLVTFRKLVRSELESPDPQLNSGTEDGLH